MPPPSKKLKLLGGRWHSRVQRSLGFDQDCAYRAVDDGHQLCDFAPFPMLVRVETQKR